MGSRVWGSGLGFWGLGLGELEFGLAVGVLESEQLGAEEESLTLTACFSGTLDLPGLGP